MFQYAWLEMFIILKIAEDLLVWRKSPKNRHFQYYLSSELTIAYF